MDRVLDLAVTWANEHRPQDSELIIKRTPGRTPIILIDIPGGQDGNILMYGHLDKQPEMAGWADGLGPWTPVMKDNNFMAGVRPTTVMLFLLLFAPFELWKNRVLFTLVF